VHDLAARRGELVVLDVREIREFEGEGHIPDAVHMWVGDLEERHRDLGLSNDARLAVTCSVGHRAGLAVSILRRLGYRDVSNLIGGMTAWNAAGLPTRERGPGREPARR
jgi:hydroxyacylglutathione hydrolase